MNIARECLHKGLYIPHLEVASGAFLEWYRRTARPHPVPALRRTSKRQPKHICIEPECGALVTNPGRRCQTHANRIRRAKILAKHADPICLLCGAPRDKGTSLCREHYRAYWRARTAAKNQNQLLSIAQFIATP